MFLEVHSKFQKCFGTEITESCMCDDSEVDLTELPQGFEIKLKKESPKNYYLALYDTEKKENVDGGKEKSFNVGIGLISHAARELEVVGRSQTSPFCTKGLGLVDSFSLSIHMNTHFSLVHNIDSRFYLQAFGEDNET